jgi:hypothetical protein
MPVAASPFKSANPYALDTIVRASESRRIVASQDIFDERGVKLWAKDQPISRSLHERLLERKLRRPLESCLRAEDGINSVRLRQAFEEFVDSSHPLAAMVRPSAALLRAEIEKLPLHAGVQVLLTAAHATQPATVEHAVRGMALAATLQAGESTGKYELRLALLAGLLHDIGEMYVNPDHLDGAVPLDPQGFRHLATHPRVGELLLATTTDYPAAIARAIGEHHERLDGSGYPMMRQAAALSPLGRLLAGVEVTLGVTQAAKTPLARTSVALRMIPGEFDGRWSDVVVRAARDACEDLQPAADRPDAQVQADLASLDSGLLMALGAADALANQPADGSASAATRQVAARAVALLSRLRVGWNAMGLWEARSAGDQPLSAFELHMACRELRYRLHAVRRDCLWARENLEAADAAALEAVWSLIES